MVLDPTIILTPFVQDPVQPPPEDPLKAKARNSVANFRSPDLTDEGSRSFWGNFAKDFEELVVSIPAFIKILYNGASEWVADPEGTWKLVFEQGGAKEVGGIVAGGFVDQYTNENGDFDLGNAFYQRPLSTILDATGLLDVAGLGVRTAGLSAKAVGAVKMASTLEKTGVAISRAPMAAVRKAVIEPTKFLLRQVPKAGRPGEFLRILSENVGINVFQDANWQKTAKWASDLETETFSAQKRALRDVMAPGIAEDRWLLIENAARTPEWITAQKIKGLPRHKLRKEPKQGTFWRQLSEEEADVARELRRHVRSWEEQLKARGVLPEYTKYAQWGEAVVRDPAIRKMVREASPHAVGRQLKDRQLKNFYRLPRPVKDGIVSYLESFKLETPDGRVFKMSSEYLPLYRSSTQELIADMEKIGVRRPAGALRPGELRPRRVGLAAGEVMRGRQLVSRFVERRVALTKLVDRIPQLKAAMGALDYAPGMKIPKGFAYFPVDLVLKTFTDESTWTRELVKNLIKIGPEGVTAETFSKGMQRTMGELLTNPSLRGMIEGLTVPDRLALGRIWVVPRSSLLEFTRRVVGSYPTLLGRIFHTTMDLYKLSVLAFALGPWYYLQNVISGSMQFLLSGGTPGGLFRAMSKRWETLLPDRYRVPLRNVMMEWDDRLLQALPKGIQVAFLVKPARTIVEGANRIDSFFRKAAFLSKVEAEARRAVMHSANRSFWPSFLSVQEADRLIGEALKGARLYDRYERASAFIVKEVGERRAKIELLEKEYKELNRKHGRLYWELQEEQGIPTTGVRRKVTGAEVRLRDLNREEKAAVAAGQDMSRIRVEVEKLSKQLVEDTRRMEAFNNRFSNLIPGMKEGRKIVDDSISHAETFLFNYFNANAAERTWIRSLFPFWFWFRNINSLFVKLPFISPWRTFAWNRMARAAFDLYDDPEKPDWLMGYLPVGTDEHGHLIFLPMSSMNPISSVLDPRNPERAFVSRLNPFIIASVEEVSGRPIFSRVPAEKGVFGTVTGRLYEYNSISGEFRDKPHLSVLSLPGFGRRLLSNFFPFSAMEELLRKQARNERNEEPAPESVLDSDGVPTVPLWAVKVLRAVSGTRLRTEVELDNWRRRENMTRRLLRTKVVSTMRRAARDEDWGYVEQLRKMLEDLRVQRPEDF